MSDTTWNTCPLCDELVDEVDDETPQGHEVRCASCEAPLVVEVWQDDTRTLEVVAVAVTRMAE